MFMPALIIFALLLLVAGAVQVVILFLNAMAIGLYRSLAEGVPEHDRPVAPGPGRRKTGPALTKAGLAQCLHPDVRSS